VKASEANFLDFIKKSPQFVIPVDIVPQAGRLRLSLDMEFADIIDPLSLCKDITGMGHWSNGDIEVALTSLEHLPYIMGLVRQSFERQIGNEGEP